jgi:hypothetical protein
MSVFGVMILYRTGTADFEPWEEAKRRLIVAAIFVAMPANTLAFHFLPIYLAVFLSLVLTALVMVEFVLTVPQQWRRVVGKKG